MDESVIITGLIGAGSTILSYFCGWFFTRRRYNTEVNGSVIENMKNSLDFYQKLSDDNRIRLEEVQAENKELRAQVDELRAQVFNMMSQICLNVSCELRESVKKSKTNAGNSKKASKER